MTKNKDTDLREALHRKYADTPQLPENFSERLMQRIMQQDEKPKPRRIWLYPAISAAAACLLFWLIPHYYNNKVESKEQPMVALQAVQQHNIKKTVAPQAPPVVTQEKETRPAHNARTKQKQHVQPPQSTLQTVIAPAEEQKIQTDKNLHYAKHKTTDTVYQAPSHMEEFIVKMAHYHNVHGDTLECSPDKNDPTIICTAYIFEDNEELHLFDRLLQAACWYDSKTPGYFLNYSHQQFFFFLKDLRLRLKYLWIAERVNDKILLYSTHSPIDVEVSSETYQKYREKQINKHLHLTTTTAL